MFRFRSLATGVAVVALLATGVAYAQGPRGGGRFGGPGGPGPLGLELRALNLTDAQREQVSEIRDRYREQMRTSVQRLTEVSDKQRQAIETLPVNETLITSATQDMTQAQVEVAVQQARLNADVWSVLTPEQQAQATKLRAERKTRFEERRQEVRQRQNNK
jgi:Spy/CpxP family protein refolding chaperone